LTLKIDSNDASLERSATLQGYSHLIDEIRKNQKAGMTRDKAIATAIDYCIENDILKDFLKRNYAEVIKMLNWEYNADTEKRVLTEEAMQKGMQQGMQQGRQETIELLAELIKEGTPIDEAMKIVSASFTDPQ
jgi:flagellar biosynthesis/type III secretory pathway protein FliH